MVNYKKTLENMLQILEILSLNKHFAQYDVNEEIDVSYKTALRYLKDLEQEKYINLSHTEPSAKGGKERNIYEITYEGLLVVLSLNDAIWDRIQEVAKQHENKLPLIFGKFDYYRDKGVLEEVIKRFRMAMFKRRQYIVDLFSQIGSLNIKDIEIKELLSGFEKGHRKFLYYIQEQWKEEITNEVIFGYPWLGKPIQQQSFLSKLKGDPDLHKYITNYFEKMNTLHEEYLGNIKLWKDFYADLKTEFDVKH